jgi:hypothetical protein
MGGREQTVGKGLVGDLEEGSGFCMAGKLLCVLDRDEAAIEG